jgi:hypothetical protein
MRTAARAVQRRPKRPVGLGCIRGQNGCRRPLHSQRNSDVTKQSVMLARAHLAALTLGRGWELHASHLHMHAAGATFSVMTQTLRRCCVVHVGMSI